MKENREGSYYVMLSTSEDNYEQTSIGFDTFEEASNFKDNYWKKEDTDFMVIFKRVG